MLRHGLEACHPSIWDCSLYSKWSVVHAVTLQRGLKYATVLPHWHGIDNGTSDIEIQKQNIDNSSSRCNASALEVLSDAMILPPPTPRIF
jgi:hypothetical protein